MFGRKIDYYILKSMARRAPRDTPPEATHPERSLPSVLPDDSRQIARKFIDRLGGHLPIDLDLRYIDVGCGHGSLDFGLVDAGAGHVTGLDYNERAIRGAAATVNRLCLQDRLEFISANFNEWSPERPYDVVLSLESLEHIEEPQKALSRFAALAKPGGLICLGFGPLYHSPCGDHQEKVYRVQVPWRGVLFSRHALYKVHKEYSDSLIVDDLTMGMNGMKFSEFLRFVGESGLSVEYLQVNPQLKLIKPLYWISETLRRIPIVRDYFVMSVYTVLRLRPSPHRPPGVSE